MCNPGLDGRPLTTHTLAAGFQLLLPGEFARAHRHTNTSLRLVVEGSGGYTVTEGEKSRLAPGDFVSSPNWTWHDHGNDGPEPVIWLDVVDVPIVAAFNSQRFEPFQVPRQTVTGENATSGLHTPFASIRQELEAHGLCNLGTSVPTLAAEMRRLEPGREVARQRSTASTVFMVCEGRGHSVIGEQRFDWQPHYVFVVPSWAWHEHVAQGSSPAVLFSVTDQPALAALGLYVEETP
jgi:gentisate 1,2-dioxygenase